MSKYLCLCGRAFTRKKHADKHAALFKDADELTKNFHVMVKKLWRARLMDLWLDYPWGRLFRVLGGYMIWLVLAHHYQINLTIWEATFMGIGLGLYID
jgi:hypothetical protein